MGVVKTIATEVMGKICLSRQFVTSLGHTLSDLVAWYRLTAHVQNVTI